MKDISRHGEGHIPEEDLDQSVLGSIEPEQRISLLLFIILPISLISLLLSVVIIIIIIIISMDIIITNIIIIIIIVINVSLEFSLFLL